MSSPMTNKQALREAAEKANPEQYGFYLVDAFTELATPATVLALLDELEAAEKRIAELEAREVRISRPKIGHLHGALLHLWPAYDVQTAVEHAGIKFKVED